MQHPRTFDTVHKQRLAGKQAAVLIARDRSAEITGSHRIPATWGVSSRWSQILGYAINVVGDGVVIVAG